MEKLNLENRAFKKGKIRDGGTMPPAKTKRKSRIYSAKRQIV